MKTLRDSLNDLELWINRAKWLHLTPVERGILVGALDRTAGLIRAEGTAAQEPPDTPVGAQAFRREVIELAKKHLSLMSPQEAMDTGLFFHRLADKFDNVLADSLMDIVAEIQERGA